VCCAVHAAAAAAAELLVTTLVALTYSPLQLVAIDWHVTTAAGADFSHLTESRGLGKATLCVRDHVRVCSWACVFIFSVSVCACLL